ncbi:MULTISPECIES: pilus assembly protein [unclassified Haloferax]|uniref:Pilus assembly protein n=1 Tax=Haloferax sp. Atlit-48N TaxID=2077198 RepID=A0ACD5HXT0_9EURY|nr:MULTISPECIES: pilus assembly protein [unclassified Haloferax]RDZ33075.1 pilus assembly protein [Haloferax sp. Atlit-48N]RDZ37235.1 pilus assembly protein [Haloferax sp. Atlit-24N]RDZ41263.1 pilus assembly protein [Haloferax sp. Atlit-47N]RLM38032.1 pilus assembly protein [Haloferax sp. Atlit-109R]RLM45975.1 pilus assembly protein [Haloferax sp. Atlit-105R]
MLNPDTDAPADPDSNPAVRTAATTLARLSPDSIDAEPSDELRRSLAFLDSDLAPETVVAAGYGAALPAGLLGGLVALVARLPTVTVVFVALAAALGATHAVHTLPVWLATLRRTRALGNAPELVGRIALRMRIEPSVERASAFAARGGDDPLSTSLAAHTDRARGTPTAGLSAFADAWRAWFPALDRSTALLQTAADVPAGERDRALDRAHEVVREGTRDRLADFVGSVRGPVTAVYAFGVLLPLALVGALPAARVAGVGVTAAHVAFVYDVALPACLLAAVGWVLVRRPVAFAPLSVDASHPAVDDHRLLGVAGGAVAGIVGFVAADALVAPWLAPLAAAGLGTGTALFVAARPVVALRARVRAVEDGLPDALYLVGRAVSEGEAVESALARAATSVPGETGDLLDEAVGVQRRLRVGVVESFRGEYGVLESTPSPRVAGVATLLGLAASEGRPAGRAIVSMADQLSALSRLDAEARRELASVTETLSNTAAVFGPLVAGATVALADGMAPAKTLDQTAVATPLSTADLGLAVGAYVLLSAVILTTLSVGVEHGLDRHLVASRVGRALVSATATFAVAFAAAGTLV